MTETELESVDQVCSFFQFSASTEYESSDNGDAPSFQ